MNRATVYERINGPVQCHRQFPITDEESHRWAHAQFMAVKGAIRNDTGTAHACVNHGIWMVVCRCGSGAAASVLWGVACCFGCGSVYSDVVFPDDRPEIERVLLMRDKRKHQNWTNETLDVLLSENVEHGIGGG